MDEPLCRRLWREAKDLAGLVYTSSYEENLEQARSASEELIKTMERLDFYRCIW
jgi:hypothetical protein